MPSSTVFIVLVLVGTSMNAGVFRYKPEALHGDLVYRIYLEDKVMCLKDCYEESYCTVNVELCELYKSGKSGAVSGYIISCEESDAACTLIEINDTTIPFQKIQFQEKAKVNCSNPVSDVAIINPYKIAEGFRFFVPSPTKIPNDWTATEHRLFVSKKKEETCTPVPIFHKANTRRLYFGEVLNTTRFYFYNAYAYADYCVSPEGECLGVFEIQEYADKKGLYFYDEAGRKDLKDSGLGQKFYIAGIVN